MTTRTPKSDSSKTDWRIIGLLADEPLPELKEELMLFGQFIGDWDIIEASYPQPHGTEITKSGEVHFGWILDGRAVQDVWMTHDKQTGRAIPVGTTIRFYDPKLGAWRSTWINPIAGIVQTFIARKVDDRIVLESKIHEGYPEKWIFSKITPNSFTWHSEETHDNGKTWIITEEMKIQKRLAKS